MHTMTKSICLSGFPFIVPAERVKKLLERITGEGTVVAVKVHLSSEGPMSYANAQFVDTRCLKIIFSVPDEVLHYGFTLLNAWQLNADIVSNPRHYKYDLKEVALYFGSQISPERFFFLWKGTSVSIKIENELRKMFFFLCFDSVDYKLQLSDENIWKIVLYRPQDQTAKLVIQLHSAPRIYKKLDDSLYSYFKDPPDDQWIRTIDFTSSCIGQSSGLCVELPCGTRLPFFGKKFACYEESETPFCLEQIVPFSHNPSVVPVLHPSRRFDLPYNIMFKICSLVQIGRLPGPKVDAKFFRLVNPNSIDIQCIEHVLEKLYYLKDCCYDPFTWLHHQYEKYIQLAKPHSSPSIHLDNGMVYVRRVRVTPAKIYFSGPEVSMSNRVIRHYHENIDNFLRVSFVDEELDKLYPTELSAEDGNGRTDIYNRILSVLREGIQIGDKKFEFLAFSKSQLQENTVWMFAGTTNHSADDVRLWMGNFCSIRNVAKYAARLGQSFGSSMETLSVEKHEIEMIPDIEVSKDGKMYIFSDGIGKISSEFAERVAKICGFQYSVPSAFQIRYGGYKGVVAIDPSSFKKLSLRPSMCKYQSENTKLDVLHWSKFQPCYLNRQIITLLSTLGVQDHIFLRKQKEIIAKLDKILVDSVKARKALVLMSLGQNTEMLNEMLKCGFTPEKEPFLLMLLQIFQSSKLLDLRMKARIFVPKARQMMGCLDETGTLEYGQVFVQISNARCQHMDKNSILFNDGVSNRNSYVVQGKVVVAKNPCLHPGDVRVLNAIDVPSLHHMVDCIIFPQKGQRPHPNECSGSDLDGDIYFVCWDSDLVPPRQVSPMDYTPAPVTILDHDVTIEEVQKFFTNFIVDDSLGVIANAHIVFADKEPKKALSYPCIELAKMFSIAVDFPKTGIPAVIPSHLRVKDYPDFMEKTDKPKYFSRSVIGKLYRAVKSFAPESASLTSFTKEVAELTYDQQMEVNGYKDYIDKAFQYKTEYDFKLGNLMDHYGIKTEAEIISGEIMKMKKFGRRNDQEAITAAVASLRNEARSWYDQGIEADYVYAKASAWYHVTYHPDYWGCYNDGFTRDHFLSFPWCVYDKLVKIKKDSSILLHANINSPSI